MEDFIANGYALWELICTYILQGAFLLFVIILPMVTAIWLLWAMFFAGRFEKKKPEDKQSLGAQILEKDRKISELKDKIERLEREKKDIRNTYEKTRDRLWEAQSEYGSFKNSLYPDLEKLADKYENIFISFPKNQELYQRLADARFHRSLIEDMSFAEKVQYEYKIKSGDKTYNTSLQGCNCEDYLRNHQPCKHMLFVAYHGGILLLNHERAEQHLKIYLDELRESRPLSKSKSKK